MYSCLYVYGINRKGYIERASRRVRAALVFLQLRGLNLDERLWQWRSVVGTASLAP